LAASCWWKNADQIHHRPPTKTLQPFIHRRDPHGNDCFSKSSVKEGAALNLDLGADDKLVVGNHTIQRQLLELVAVSPEDARSSVGGGCSLVCAITIK